MASTINVKQGCPLSPTLFGLYIDEISKFIDRGGGEGASLQGLWVSLMLYADDIILMSDSQEGLQRHMDALGD
ncbi:reverse transcriptase domain-containing protein, partial [Escherichia coli]|uniref:reverse transcriptase domain-containing protein n=1 Tax=Escherichia coli TaxID=562 RepID=UPI0034D9583F